MLSNNRSASFVFYHGIYLFFFAAFLRSLNVINCDLSYCYTILHFRRIVLLGRIKGKLQRLRFGRRCDFLLG